MKTKSKPDLVPIPSQTVGPYFRISLMGPRAVKQIAGPQVKGERVKSIFKVLDAEGKRVSQVMGDEAERWGATLIVMGTHGRTGLAHVLMGSVAERVVQKAPCPVLTIRHPDRKFKHPLDK